jgi:hypothetical protein
VITDLVHGRSDISIADRNFYTWTDWKTAGATGAQLLWRVKAGLTLPVIRMLGDGPYSSVLINPKNRGTARRGLIEAAAPGRTPTPSRPWGCGSSSTPSPTATVTARAS